MFIEENHYDLKILNWKKIFACLLFFFTPKLLKRRFVSIFHVCSIGFFLSIVFFSLLRRWQLTFWKASENAVATELSSKRARNLFFTIYEETAFTNIFICFYWIWKIISHYDLLSPNTLYMEWWGIVVCFRFLSRINLVSLV